MCDNLEEDEILEETDVNIPGKSDNDEKDPLLSNVNFPFESESLALKGNEDYIKLMECLATLEGARIQNIQDMEILLDLQDEALKEPFKFIERLTNGENLGIPTSVVIPDIPKIDWTKYKVSIPLDNARPTTRPKPSKPDKMEPPGEIVRGRVRGSSKSSTYNQLWTVDEQLKLEQLLIKYPQEMNEARRFAKIAKELGNRTLSQVTSRCQKYFLKLLKAGLPVPGRISRSAKTSTRTGKYARRMPSLHKSTFFPHSSNILTIHSEDLPGTSHVPMVRIKEEPMDCSEDDVPQEVKDSEEYRKLVLLRRVKADMEKFGDSTVPHNGFKCDICNVEPILGTRWHCEDCGEDEHSIDMCSTCVIQQMEGDAQRHPLAHTLNPYRVIGNTTNPWDKDYSYDNYLSINQSGYNYLDPNFQPD